MFNLKGYGALLVNVLFSGTSLEQPWDQQFFLSVNICNLNFCEKVRFNCVKITLFCPYIKKTHCDSILNVSC